MARTKVPVVVISAATGSAISSASVRVKIRATGADATVYAAATGATTVTNPLTTNAQGRVSGWVDRGNYTATITGTGITTYDEEFESSPAGDRDIDDLWLPADASASIGTSLTASPANGEKYVYQADTANGILWEFRYNSGSASTYKWELVGGNYLFANINTNEGRGSTGYADLATNGPSVVLPLAGDYEVEWGCRCDWPSNSTAAVAPAVNGTVNTNYELHFYNSSGAPGNAVGPPGMRCGRLTGVAAGATIKLLYNPSVSPAWFSQRWIRARPLRVS